MKKILFTALIAIMALTACNEEIEEPKPKDPDVVSTLTLTVTSSGDFQLQQPPGHIYLFHSDQADCNLSYATVEGDGSMQPLVDITRQYSPVVRFKATTLHPVSPYGNLSGGNLDTSSSARYSQITFDIASLSTDYGTVKKGETLLVLIILDAEDNRSWTFHALDLRRDHIIHIAIPANKNRTYVPETDLNAKWWQEE